MQSVPKGHRERMSAERGEKMSVPKGHDKRVCENTKDVPEDEECPRRQKMQGKVQALTLVLQIWLWRGLWPRSPPPNENTPGAGENCRGDSESLWKAISIVFLDGNDAGGLPRRWTFWQVWRAAAHEGSASWSVHLAGTWHHLASLRHASTSSCLFPIFGLDNTFASSRVSVD